LKYSGHAGQIDDVMTAIETGKDWLIKGEDGRLTIELISAIYKAGAEGRVVHLPLGNGDNFYTLEGIMAAVPRFHKKTRAVRELPGTITLGAGS
jgi:hypothetical protein